MVCFNLVFRVCEIAFCIHVFLHVKLSNMTTLKVTRLSRKIHNDHLIKFSDGVNELIFSVKDEICSFGFIVITESEIDVSIFNFEKIENIEFYEEDENGIEIRGYPCAQKEYKFVSVGQTERREINYELAEFIGLINATKKTTTTNFLFQ